MGVSMDMKVGIGMGEDTAGTEVGIDVSTCLGDGMRMDASASMGRAWPWTWAMARKV